MLSADAVADRVVVSIHRSGVGGIMLVEGTPELPIDEGRETELVELLMSIALSMRNLLHLQMMEIEVLPGQDQLLMALGRGELRKLSKVADEVQVRPSTASKIVDQLEKRGWVIREKFEGDGRAVAVRVTPEGDDIRRKVGEVWSVLESDLAVDLGDSAVTQVHGALKQVDVVLRSKLARLR